ncbi:efflux RND transporter periplasmic adaptor subunit [Salegentibacter sp. LM13S]|uniref:HlyD family secretion protein n=1 Tax=Salegentibacter lacus TaxID=2873599 RepID=UPI001CCCB172|nr:efflux RND transporter periplasmic adaptor subunit [Salegentibacter lacus]MBZ9629511.1 efflux RND transporter periplasmic adaptor subunit [Salegentibacter lacus]
MKTIKIGISLISLLVLASCSNEQEITPYRGKVKFETIAVSSKLAGRINKLYVAEGEDVQKGDTLAFLDIPEINAKMIQADGAMKAARGQLNMANVGATAEQLIQIEGKLDAAKAELQFASESYSRLDNMFKDSLVTRQQLDEVNMKLKMARAQVAALEARRTEAGKSARTEQLDQAQGQLDRARGAREEVLVASNEMYLIAPANMTIETISLKEGELLGPGYSLFNGYKKNSIYLRFTVNESRIYDFKVGSELVMLNPYTDEEFTGRLATIKQLPQYADITSTAPLYDLSESVYELKVIPTSDISGSTFYTNATILLKE